MLSWNAGTVAVMESNSKSLSHNDLVSKSSPEI